jgi:hypothetical protein
VVEPEFSERRTEIVAIVQHYCSAWIIMNHCGSLYIDSGRSSHALLSTGIL